MPWRFPAPINININILPTHLSNQKNHINHRLTTSTASAAMGNEISTVSSFISRELKHSLLKVGRRLRLCNSRGLPFSRGAEDQLSNQSFPKVFKQFQSTGGHAVQSQSTEADNLPSQSTGPPDLQSLLRVVPQPPTNPTSYQACLVSHNIQVFSVSFHPYFSDDRPCEIYGSIRVADDEEIIPIYNRNQDDAETISSAGGTLSLIDQKNEYISCRIGGASMDLHLVDKVRDTVFLNKSQLTLHAKEDDIENSCDKLQKAVVQGEHGFACIYYAKFLHAMIATVKIDIFLKDSKIDNYNDCPFIDVYGSVVAGYGDAKRFCNSDEYVEHMKSTLFNKPSHQSVRAMIGSPISLSRSVVAVPPYSSLIIEADLMDSYGQVVARGSAEFLAGVCADFIQFIHGERYVIQVRVRWGDGYRLKHNRDSSILAYPNASTPITHGRCSSSASDSSGSMEVVQGWSRAEVFSIYVTGLNHEVSSICGKIAVNDPDPWNIFDRSPENPQVLTTGKMVATLEGYDDIECNNFYVEMCLKDPVNELEVSKGSINWCDGSLRDYSGQLSLHDRFLCSMVRGSHGYAVVHYTIFDEACRATVEMSFYHINPSTTDSVNIYGCVLTSYDNFNYSTPYIKKHFRSRLFDKALAESVQLTSDSRIPLLKSVVAVSIYSSLVIEVDLHAMSVGSTFADALYGKVEMQIDINNMIQKEIGGERCRVVLSVKFEEVC